MNGKAASRGTGTKRSGNGSVPAARLGFKSLHDAAANRIRRYDRGRKPTIRFCAPLDVSRCEGIEPPGDVVTDIRGHVVLIIPKEVSRSAECVR